MSSYNKWVICSDVRPEAKFRVFCFPYAGGNAQIYRSWSKVFPEFIEVMAVNLPGHGSRIMEPAISRLDPLVRSIAEAIYPYLKEKQFAFFGHSMGALVCFELSRHIFKEYNICPVHLFVSAHCAPQLPSRYAGQKDYMLPDNELLKKVKDLNGTPQWMLENEEIMQLAIPIMRADMEVCQTYNYVDELPLQVPITAFAGSQDECVSIDEIRSWKEQTNKNFRMEVISGDHFFIQSMGDLVSRSVAEELKRIFYAQI